MLGLQPVALSSLMYDRELISLQPLTQLGRIWVCRGKNWVRKKASCKCFLSTRCQLVHCGEVSKTQVELKLVWSPGVKSCPSNNQ